jgi:hypothetical protein
MESGSHVTSPDLDSRRFLANALHGVPMQAFENGVRATESARTPFGEAAPFLQQARASGALRHELDRLIAAVESRIDTESARDAELLLEVSTLPNRIVARCGSLAISFSWLGGRLGGISDGHLLVIEWTGIAPGKRGTSALKSGTLSRETAYHPEADGPANWAWRAGNETNVLRSSADLVGDWFDLAAA